MVIIALALRGESDNEVEERVALLQEDDDIRCFLGLPTAMETGGLYILRDINKCPEDLRSLIGSVAFTPSALRDAGYAVLDPFAGTGLYDSWAPQYRFHTVVTHRFPDVEAEVMRWILANDEISRIRLGLPDDPEYRFIASGSLQRCDFPEIPEGVSLTPDTLEAHGFLAIDCGGGGRFDQHSRTRNKRSSLDLLVEYTGFLDRNPEFSELVRLVSLNDLEGVAIVTDHEYRESPFPHTQRTLRQVLIGWNMLFADQPMTAVLEAQTAISAIMGSIRHGELPPGGVRQLFLMEYLIPAVQREYVRRGQTSCHSLPSFKNAVERSLSFLEAEWEIASDDYWAERTRVFSVQVPRRNRDGTFRVANAAVVAGWSESQRFGQVARRGGPPEYEGQQGEVRPRADIVIQFYADGKFLISTRCDDLSVVAQSLRATELHKVNEDMPCNWDMLAEPGNLVTEDGTQLLYLTEYRRAVGNTFRSKPDANASPLSAVQVIDIVVRAFREQVSAGIK